MNTNNNGTVLATRIDAEHVPEITLRKTALIAGTLYLLTFVSIPTIAIYSSIHGASYIAGAGSGKTVITGGILEIIVALAGIGTAIVLYPVLKRQNESLALGLVACRVLEAGTMFVGVAFISSAVNSGQVDAATAGVPARPLLVALYDRIFLLGQSFMPALNDLLLGVLLYQSRLVPKAISLTGIIGAFPLVAGYLAVLFGFIGQHDPLAGLCALLVALFEFSLGTYLVVKGFKSPVTTGNQ